MAIYHFSVKNISRSDGRSAVACSAYRSGEKLIDERQGKEQDYTKKTGVEYKVLWSPKGTSENLITREKLWNTVEATETRKNSQLAREFEIAFPHELNKEQRQDMLNELCKDIVRRHNVVVDAVIHAPHTKSGSDERNYHAHIMFTTRSINEHGELGKKTREFNDQGKQQVEFWRERFAEITNQNLARAGYLTEVDHRSYSEQKNGLEATIHEGSKVTQLRRQGIKTEISQKNDVIKQRNAEKQRFPQVLSDLERQIQQTQAKISQYQQEKRDNEPNSPKLKELNAKLTRLKSEINQFKADMSRLWKDYEELNKKRPKEKLFGLVNNPQFTAWKEQYADIKREYDQQQASLKLNERLVLGTESDIQYEIENIKNPPKIEFNDVFKQLNQDQKMAYQILKSALERKNHGLELDKKILMAQEKFIQKFKENPNFEVPKAQFKQQQEIKKQEKTRGFDR